MTVGIDQSGHQTREPLRIIVNRRRGVSLAPMDLSIRDPTDPSKDSTETTDSDYPERAGTLNPMRKLTS